MTEQDLSPATVARRLAAVRSVVKVARLLGRVACPLDESERCRAEAASEHGQDRGELMEVFEGNNRYRLAYGLAADLAEAESHGSAVSGRTRLNPAAGGSAERMMRAVVERYGDDPDVREGVDDALAKRPPRW
jgi:hypothetical protein